MKHERPDPDMPEPRSPKSAGGEVTALLARMGEGDTRAADELLPCVYEQLRGLAGSYLRDERRDHTLQATALVHEAYVRLVGSESSRWESRRHFYRVAATAMRRILVDHARRHRSAKRGGGHKVPLDELPQLGAAPREDLVALDDALTGLASFDAEKSRIVEMRFFVGLDNRETAEVLGLSLRSVERSWSLARAWLYREISGGGAEP